MIVTTHRTNLERHTAHAVADCLRQSKGKPTLLLVSGGSALAVLSHIDPMTLGEQTTISLVDDRFSRNPEVNNFSQLTRTEFYKHAKARGASFISSLPEEGESLGAVADRWEKALRAWSEAHPTGRTVLAILGIGRDGHTAGIMPYPEDPQTFSSLFENEERWIVGYDAGDKNQYPLRMTASIPFLTQMVNRAFVYVSGKDKQDALKKAMEEGELAECPARVVHRLERVDLYSDEDKED